VIGLYRTSSCGQCAVCCINLHQYQHIYLRQLKRFKGGKIISCEGCLQAKQLYHCLNGNATKLNILNQLVEYSVRSVVCVNSQVFAQKECISAAIASCPAFVIVDIEASVTSAVSGVACLAPCSTEPCLNGGTCIELSATTYSCECASQFTGDRCQTS
jgi:EGF-like domain